jgi:hypothetical protein
MKYEYLQTLLVIYAQEDMELLQFDIKIVCYIHLDEEIYMVQPLGFEQTNVEHKVCLLKSLIIWALSSIPIVEHEIQCIFVEV